jgi:hypothetical protein
MKKVLAAVAVWLRRVFGRVKKAPVKTVGHYFWMPETGYKTKKDKYRSVQKGHTAGKLPLARKPL